MIFSPPFFFWRERKSLMIVSDARSILDGWSRNTFGGCRSVIDATLRTVVVVVYSTIKGRGGGKKWESSSSSSSSFFIIKRMADLSSVGGPITLTTCYMRCVVALIFFFALSVETYSIVPSLFYTVTMTKTSNIQSFLSPSTLIYLK